MSYTYEDSKNANITKKFQLEGGDTWLKSEPDSQKSDGLEDHNFNLLAFNLIKSHSLLLLKAKQLHTNVHSNDENYFHNL